MQLLQVGHRLRQGAQEGLGRQQVRLPRLCTCLACRWLVFLLTAPILLALWLVGAVIWLVLLPLKCCCPCCGGAAWVARQLGAVAPAPAGARAAHAVGKPWDDDKPADKKEQGNQKVGKQ